MQNHERYLASRFGMTTSYRLQNTPYGWEIPDEDNYSNTPPAQPNSSGTRWLLALLAAWVIVALLIHMALKQAEISPNQFQNPGSHKFHGPIMYIQDGLLERQPQQASIPAFKFVPHTRAQTTDSLPYRMPRQPSPCDCRPRPNNTFEIA